MRVAQQPQRAQDVRVALAGDEVADRDERAVVAGRRAAGVARRQRRCRGGRPGSSRAPERPRSGPRSPPSWPARGGRRRAPRRTARSPAGEASRDRSTSPPWTETTSGRPRPRAAHRVARRRGVVGVDEVEREPPAQRAAARAPAAARPTRPSSRRARPRRGEERHVGDLEPVELGVQRLAQRREQLAPGGGCAARPAAARAGAARARGRRRRRRAPRAPGGAPTRRAPGRRRAGSTPRRPRRASAQRSRCSGAATSRRPARGST